MKQMIAVALAITPTTSILKHRMNADQVGPIWRIISLSEQSVLGRDSLSPDGECERMGGRASGPLDSAATRELDLLTLNHYTVFTVGTMHNT